MAGKRPEWVKPPDHLSGNPPVPMPEKAKKLDSEPRDYDLEPTRYGDWEHKGIAWDF